MNTENDIRKKISDYLRETGMRQKEFADELGLKETTFSKIMNGERRFTEKNIKAATFILLEKEEKRTCFLEKCPATPPADNFLKEILDVWNYLNKEERARVAGVASKIADDKKGDSFTDGNCS